MHQIDIEELTGGKVPAPEMPAAPRKGVTDNKSSKDRVARFKQRKRAEGMIEITVWIPSAAAADVRQLAQRLSSDTDLTVGPVRRISTGKLERL